MDGGEWRCSAGRSFNNEYSVSCSSSSHGFTKAPITKRSLHFSPLSEGKQSLPLPRAHLRALEESARRQLARRFPVAGVGVGRASEISRSLSFDGPITPANGPRLGFRLGLTGEHAHGFNERMRVETLMSIARSVRPTFPSLSLGAARECKESRKEEGGEDFE